MKKNCDCVCHKLGYVYCGPGHCPDHPASDKPADDRSAGAGE